MRLLNEIFLKIKSIFIAQLFTNIASSRENRVSRSPYQGSFPSNQIDVHLSCNTNRTTTIKYVRSTTLPNKNSRSPRMMTDGFCFENGELKIERKV